MSHNIKNVVFSFFSEVRDGIIARHYDRIDDFVLDERIKGIENATAALCEAKVKDDLIVSLLIKYWDLRPSEAKDFLQQTKRYLKQKNIKLST